MKCNWQDLKKNTFPNTFRSEEDSTKLIVRVGKVIKTINTNLHID